MKSLFTLVAAMLAIALAGAASAATLTVGVRLDVSKQWFYPETAQVSGDFGVAGNQQLVVNPNFQSVTQYGVVSLNWVGGREYDAATIRLTPTLRTIFGSLALSAPSSDASGGALEPDYKLLFDQTTQLVDLGGGRSERFIVAELLQPAFGQPAGTPTPYPSLGWQAAHFKPGSTMDWYFDSARWTQVGQEATDIVGARYFGTVTVVSLAGVPEPTTWGFMICGFGLAGAALRRRAPLTA